VAFALWVVNEEHSPLTSDGKRERRIHPDNTLVIASSVSNGGGAALAAAEQDSTGLIDAVAVAELLASGRQRLVRLTVPEGSGLRSLAEAAEKAVAIAHAVHGAIGVTAEYDLQLVTRRLQEGRGDFGSAGYWHGELGRALLAADEPTVPFLLHTLLPGAAARAESAG